MQDWRWFSANSSFISGAQIHTYWQMGCKFARLSCMSNYGLKIVIGVLQHTRYLPTQMQLSTLKLVVLGYINKTNLS